jgi:hypothetical protein
MEIWANKDCTQNTKQAKDQNFDWTKRHLFISYQGQSSFEKEDEQVKFRTERGHFFINSCSHLDTSLDIFQPFGNFPVE